MKKLLSLVLLLVCFSFIAFADGDIPSGGYKDCTDSQVGCVPCPEYAIQCDPNYPGGDGSGGGLVFNGDDGTFSTVIEPVVNNVGEILFSL